MRVLLQRVSSASAVVNGDVSRAQSAMDSWLWSGSGTTDTGSDSRTILRTSA